MYTATQRSFPIPGHPRSCPHIEPDGFFHHLFQGFMGRAGHGAGSHMGIGDDVLPLGCHHRPFHDFLMEGRNSPPKSTAAARNPCSRSCSFSRSSSSRVAVRAIRKAARPTSMLAMGLFMVPHPFLPRIQVLLLYQDSLVRESRDW